MSTSKTIDFVVKGDQPGRLAVRKIRVDIGALSPVGQAMVDQIFTTVRADDLSLITIRSEWTERENCRRHGWNDERIDRTEAFTGESFHKPRELRWNGWDLLRPDESPAAYFDRHARSLASEGFRIVGKQDKEGLSDVT